MTRKWCKTTYPGVRYREDDRRLYKGNADRYFSIRYCRNGKPAEEGLGWASNGWSPKKAAEVRSDLEKAYASGEGPDTLAGRREERRIAEAAQAKASAEEVAANLSYLHLVETHYVPWAKQEKKSAWADICRLKNYLYPIFKDMPLSEITPLRVEKLRDDILSKRSRATAVQVLALLRKTFNHLAKLGLHQLPNPVSSVKLPRVDNACERFFSREEFDCFISAAAKLQSPDLHDASILSVDTGLRLGEINRLMPLDVDLIHGFLTVRESDGKPGGKVPLNTRVSAMLERRLRDAGTGPLFRTTRDGDREMSRRFARMARKLGLNDGTEDRKHHITFHSLRHTFASWLAMADVDLYRIQKLMRHKTFSMVSRYAHLRPSWLRQDVEILCSPPCRRDPDDE
jgi:integrase